MIVKITRGGRLPGLMAYLAGPGRANEHTDPHLVAGSPGLMAWHGDATLNHPEALSVAVSLDAARHNSGTEVTIPEKVYDEEAGAWRTTGRRPAHVWHCSLSLAPDHRPLEDTEWQVIAEEFVDGMGFTDSGGKAECRWAAVHHGQSVNGGDHIHLAVSLVRADGTKASTHNDYKTASRLAAELEVRHGLEVVSGRHVGRSARADSKAEAYRAERSSQVETESRRLARRVRGHAAAVGSEAEFVRRCRGDGLWVRPRFAAGGQDVVTGFSVAEKPPPGRTASWRAAGRLGRDLTLPRLRESWEDSPGAAAEAAGEWRAAWRGQPVVSSKGPTVAREASAGEWQQAVNDLARLNNRLRQVSPADYSTWSKVAHETAGVLAAWSARVEGEPGPLAAAADEVARSAAMHRHDLTRQQVRGLNLRGPGHLVAMLAVGPTSATGQALLLRQLLNTLRALYDAQVATGQSRQARALRSVVTQRLDVVHRSLPDPAGVELAQRGSVGTVAGRPEMPIPGLAWGELRHVQARRDDVAR